MLISLLRIELLCSCDHDRDERCEELTQVRLAANSNDHLPQNSCNNPLLPVTSHEDGDEASMVKLKERLKLAEMNCARLEGLYQKYRHRWLEENYRAMILEEYAPEGINTHSPRQIAWDAPSPAQSTLATYSLASMRN